MRVDDTHSVQKRDRRLADAFAERRKMDGKTLFSGWLGYALEIAMPRAFSSAARTARTARSVLLSETGASLHPYPAAEMSGVHETMLTPI